MKFIIYEIYNLCHIEVLQFGIGGFSLKLFRLAKSSTRKCENFATVTDGQWQLELSNLT